MMNRVQTTCKRCGTCCKKGGPALHGEDRILVETEILGLEELVTVRKGELVHIPFQEKPRSAVAEFVKIAGTAKSWQCLFFDERNSGCSIYRQRPLSCRTLECWNSEGIQRLVEQDFLTRFDIVNKDEPVFAYMEQHRDGCPLPDLEKVYENLLKGSFPERGYFDDSVNTDIRLRSAAVTECRLSVAEEIFYFGRPLFQLFQQLGARVKENNGLLEIIWPLE